MKGNFCFGFFFFLFCFCLSVSDSSSVSQDPISFFLWIVGSAYLGRGGGYWGFFPFSFDYARLQFLLFSSFFLLVTMYLNSPTFLFMKAYVCSCTVMHFQKCLTQHVTKKCFRVNMTDLKIIFLNVKGLNNVVKRH